nr:PQQ-binding-like beta-propeller repeat protein [Pyrinomonadaceae bacterium]
MFRFTTSLLTAAIMLGTSIFMSGVFGQEKQKRSDDTVEFSRCWAVAEADTPFSVISTDGTTAFVGATGAKVAAISIATGTRSWSTELGGEIASNLSADSAGLFIVTDSVSTDAAKPKESTLRILSKETGITAKKIALAPSDSFKIGVDGGNVIVIAQSGDVYAFDAATAEVKWTRKPTGGVTGDSYIGGGSIVIGTTDGQILRLSSATGEINLTVKSADKPTAVRSLANGNIVYGDARGNVVSVDAGWKFKAGAQVSGIYEVNGALLVTSFDNFVYYFNPSNGGVIWKKRMSGRIADISFAATNQLLIFTYGGETGVLAELKKGKTMGQIPLMQETDNVSIPDTLNGRAVFAHNGTAYAFATTPCQIQNGTR